MKKYVSILRKGNEFTLNVMDDTPVTDAIKIDMGRDGECILCLEDENALAELIHAFTCVVAKENFKLGKNVAKGLFQSAKEGIRKLAEKGKEMNEKENEK